MPENAGLEMSRGVDGMWTRTCAKRHLSKPLRFEVEPLRVPVKECPKCGMMRTRLLRRPDGEICCYADLPLRNSYGAATNSYRDATGCIVIFPAKPTTVTVPQEATV